MSITAARVELDGREVARIEAIKVGGGTQVVTVDGVAEERQHPTFSRFSVRLLAPDRMISDELREVESYEEAVALGLAYAAKVAQHSAQIGELAAALKV